MNINRQRRKPSTASEAQTDGSREGAADPAWDPDRGADPLALHELIANGALDVIPGDPPVPITVWRVAGTVTAAPRDATPRLDPQAAALLIGLYTDPGDTIVDLTADAAIAGAAGGGARRYLRASHPSELVHEDRVAGAARLVLLRWPTTPDAADESGGQEAEGGLADLLTGCRQLIDRDGCVIVALTPPPRTHYIDHARRLIPAAQRAGLGYLQHIVVVAAPIPGQPPPRHAAIAGPADLRAATHLTIKANLLAFVLRRARRA